jgi:hypothetical protein
MIRQMVGSNRRALAKAHRNTICSRSTGLKQVRMRKTIAISLVVFSCSMAGPICSAQEPEVVATPAPVAGKHELFRKYVENSLGPEGMLGAALDAGFAQLRNSPSEWDQGGKGYAQRWASAYAQSAIGDTTKYAVARLLHQDPSYQRCQCTGFGPRLAHAMISPFKARNREGDWVWSPAVGASIVASHVIPAATWYPSDHGARDGLERAGTALVSKIGVRVFREFVHIPKIF